MCFTKQWHFWQGENNNYLCKIAMRANNLQPWWNVWIWLHAEHRHSRCPFSVNGQNSAPPIPTSQQTGNFMIVIFQKDPKRDDSIVTLTLVSTSCAGGFCLITVIRVPKLWSAGQTWPSNTFWLTYAKLNWTKPSHFIIMCSPHTPSMLSVLSDKGTAALSGSCWEPTPPPCVCVRT